MDIHEYQAKEILSGFGVPTPKGGLAYSPEQASYRAREIGGDAWVVKAQIHSGGRGEAGGVKVCKSEEEVREFATTLFGRQLVTKQTGDAGKGVYRVYVEQASDIAQELYLGFVLDRKTERIMIVASSQGGMEIEDLAEKDPDSLVRMVVDPAVGLAEFQARELSFQLGLTGAQIPQMVTTLRACYRAYRALDAMMVEINPLVITRDDDVIALDCKFTLCDSSLGRQAEIAGNGTPDKQTDLEAEAAAADLKYIELGGSVGVLANGAGLTMTTMDAITHYGGQPSNFLEIGGEAYTKSETALRILLKNPNIKSLLVNFCGACARTDVMAGGVVEAWKALKPDIPVFFTIHGTGEDEAVALVKSELGIQPYDLMDDAVKAAVNAAAEAAQ